MCVYFVVNMRASRIGLGWAHDVFTIAFLTLMHFHAYVLYIPHIFIYLNCFRTFLIVSFSPPHSLVYVSASWHQNVSLLCLGTFFVLGHLYLLILPPFIFGSVMRMPERTFRRTFLDEVFIRNAESFCRTSPILTYPLLFTVRVGSHCVTS